MLGSGGCLMWLVMWVVVAVQHSRHGTSNVVDKGLPRELVFNEQVL